MRDRHSCFRIEIYSRKLPPAGNDTQEIGRLDRGVRVGINDVVGSGNFSHHSLLVDN